MSVLTVKERNDNAVGDCKCDQFYQVEVCTERDEDCAAFLQISCRPYLRPVEKTKDRRPRTSRTVQHAVLMLQDAVYQMQWRIPTRLAKHYSNFERTTPVVVRTKCLLCIEYYFAVPQSDHRSSRDQRMF